MNVLPMLFYLHNLPESGAMVRRNARPQGDNERHRRGPGERYLPPPFPGRSSWTIEG